MLYLDDIDIKGPRDRYNDEEVSKLPGIRRFMLEHIQNLDKVLADLERAGATISEEKSRFCVSGMKVVGYVCDSNERHPQATKVAKILQWKKPANASEARTFIGVCMYYRIWTKNFTHVASLIYRLLRQNVHFDWGPEQIKAITLLQEALVTTPALLPISYKPDAGEIILASDASLMEWGGILMQLDKQQRRHPARYKSGLWNEAEKRYNIGKRECRGLFKILKKVRYYLYGVRFVIEINAKTLVAQLNRSASDVPGALVTRWLAWIQLFDFKVRHVSGKKHTAADGLSRRPATLLEEQEAEEEEDIDEFITAQLAVAMIAPLKVFRRPTPISVRVYPFGFNENEDESQSKNNNKEPRGKQTDKPAGVLEPGYSELSQRYATYITTLKRPVGLSTKEYRQFKAEALKFAVQNRHLFRRASKNVPIRRVIDDPDDRSSILHALHEDCGHRGKEGTYRRVADRYWWKDLAKDVARHCRTCEAYQKREPGREEEALHPTWVSVI
jgi:hypothetical protein